MAEAGERVAAQRRFEIRLVNAISPQGLARLPAELYRTGTDIAEPSALLVRSADLHKALLPASLQAIGRCGAGTNNIPVAAMSERGVPVFNAPGANANAVKELVLAGMLMAARNLAPALRFVAEVAALDPAAAAMQDTVEEAKKQFAGRELAGQTLGIVGLGGRGTEVRQREHARVCVRGRAGEVAGVPGELRL